MKNPHDQDYKIPVTAGELNDSLALIFSVTLVEAPHLAPELIVASSRLFSLLRPVYCTEGREFIPCEGLLIDGTLGIIGGSA